MEEVSAYTEYTASLKTAKNFSYLMMHIRKKKIIQFKTLFLSLLGLTDVITK
jgi:hypothetical protein